MRTIQNFILGLQFLTRIHITNKSMPCEKSDFRGAMNYFVIIGMIIGMLQYITYSVVALLAEELFAALIASIMGIVYTGGIHLDGLADIFDGFGANQNKEKTLAIMKDSTCGAFGVLAIVLDVVFHFVAIYCLRQHPMLMILIPMSGKMGVCLICYIGQSITKGLGALWIQNIRSTGMVINVLILVGMALGVTRSIFITVGMLATIGVVTVYLRRKYTDKLGGLNGDCLGATNQLVEWSILTYLVLIYS